ncbi:antibiotic biosynthesis monooxygenase [Halomonas sp. McH1-25]|uniref:antibiotic biosynthesis monooxygenase family protein n=1 Tax=unclassified Halomonas TaxID=2609666 RepID=UPI001EF4BC00|nr:MULTISPECIES: antibiotic biosynthesis monooxygenase [unclassified Halomonas]MCG7602042.1 antibiotic biosynthesis monooxygenase [Halomonas sp. McH1-25]MCP1344441.1 antibiotic biosynthesis monooxygenase [Halomonas sp. FL8]MCP1362287.1 antibiotic biosynthesis monooxygenase [Halomonas sp. BBD45]MCP1366997.1 antibiotic biosynthesis monooxygenase [Halomonas sp. BBD48]
MIKIIIERRIMPGLEQEYEQAAREAMRYAMGASGFISGESLHEHDNTQHRLLITQWRDLASWKTWQHSQEREIVMQKLLPLLSEEERITAYLHP